MKKLLLFFVLFLPVMFFAGCKSELDEVSQELTNYKLSLVFDDASMSVEGQEFVEYVNHTDNALDYVCFHLYPNAFREDAKTPVVSLSNINKAYPNGKSYGSINIENCKIDNEDATFEICGDDENILKINLKSTLYPDERSNIQINFGVILPMINHRFGYGENTINLANFYPIACVYEKGKFSQNLYHSNGDPFYSECANYEVCLECSSDYVVASSGQQYFSSNSDGKQKIKIRSQAMRDFALVLSLRFEKLEKQVDNCKIIYYYYDDDRANFNLETASKALQTFNNLFGKYPYETLSVVKTNFIHGGMEYPSLIYVSDEVTNKDEYAEVIIHEIAHQWWYGLVGNNQYENAWLDEGLTDYSTALFYEQNPDYNVKYADLIKNAATNYANIEKIYTNLGVEFSGDMTKKISEYPTEYEYTFCSYVRGMLMMDSLRSLVGDKKFMKGLKIYFQDNKFKISTPELFINSFERATHKDLESVINNFLCGKAKIATFDQG